MIVGNKEMNIFICENSVKFCYIVSAVFVLYMFLILGGGKKNCSLSI